MLSRVWRWPWQHPRITVLALILAIAATGTVGVVWWERYHYDAAQRALGRYAFDEAQYHVDQCLRVWSRSAAVQLLAAQTARRRDAYAEAQDHLETYLKIKGMDEAISLERLLLSAQQGNLSGVEASLRARTGADDPDAVPVLEAMAKGYVNCCWQVNALVCLNILLEREPQHPQAFLMRARLWEDRVLKGEAERNKDALQDYEKAVEVSPTFGARLGLAGALYRVGRPLEALGWYQQLRREQAANADVLLGLARCQFALHEVAASQQLLDELLDQQPRHAAALLERGRLAMHAGQLADAEKWLRQAAAAAPRYDCDAQRLLGRCLEAEHKTEDASQCLKELGEREANVLRVERLTLQSNREPRNVELRYQIALELMRLGREPEGMAALLYVVEQQPQHGPAHQALADYFERTGQPRRAARHRRDSGSLAR